MIRRRTLLLALVAGLIFAGPASALVTATVLEHNGVVYAPALQPQQQWLDSFKVPSPPGYVDFKIGNCGPAGWDACTTWADPAIVVVEPSAAGSKGIFAHELGHVFDEYVTRP